MIYAGFTKIPLYYSNTYFFVCKIIRPNYFTLCNKMYLSMVCLFHSHFCSINDRAQDIIECVVYLMIYNVSIRINLIPSIC